MGQALVHHVLIGETDAATPARADLCRELRPHPAGTEVPFQFLHNVYLNGVLIASAVSAHEQPCHAVTKFSKILVALLDGPNDDFG